MEINRETFKGADNSTQNLLLFDSIQHLCEKMDGFGTDCKNKHDILDKRVTRSGRINKAVTASSGLLGGFLAFFSSKFLTGG